MAKRKREIDFIAAQKLLGKTGQSTSYEFVLVITVIVVAAAIVGWYMLTRSSNKEATTALEDAKTKLEEVKGQQTANEKRFNTYTYATDANGNRIILSVNKDGTVNYKYLSITEVATAIATELANAQSASAEVQSTIDLTSTVLNIVLRGAYGAGCDVTSFSYASTKVTVSLECDTYQQMDAYRKYLQGSGEKYFGYEPTRYITGADISTWSESKDGDLTTYKFTITFTVYSDSMQ